MEWGVGAEADTQTNKTDMRINKVRRKAHTRRKNCGEMWDECWEVGLALKASFRDRKDNTFGTWGPWICGYLGNLDPPLSFPFPWGSACASSSQEETVLVVFPEAGLTTRR